MSHPKVGGVVTLEEGRRMEGRDQFWCKHGKTSGYADHLGKVGPELEGDDVPLFGGKQKEGHSRRGLPPEQTVLASCGNAFTTFEK